MLKSVPIGQRGDPYREGQRFEILADTRRKHMAIFGTTGSGKSSLLRNMIAWDLAAGAGVTVVDPHGDLIDDILDNHVPKSRTNDVIYLNPKDHERALALNILECPRREQRGLVVANVVSVFRTLWRDSWGARLEDILRNSLFALIEQPVALSLLALPKLLTDDAYRASLLSHVENPAVLDFFGNTYNRWTPSFREEAISPVMNKCRAFLTDPLMRAIIGQAHSSFDFRWAMDHRKIVLCDLSKGAIGDDNAKLLGSLIVIKEKLAALSRHDVPESERVPHVLYVDEAANFIADFESILAEARKYRLILVAALQGIEQLARESAFAVFTNCATIISFRVSATDAERLRDEFAMLMPASNLHELDDYKTYVRTLSRNDAGGHFPSGPHVVLTYPPLQRGARDADRTRVIRASYERYTEPRADVDEKLARFLNRRFKEPGK
jgi:Helicase HerA, central domain/TraM recognition site of TraD and TraG